MEVALYLPVVLRSLVALAVGILVLAGYRYVHRQSAALGTLVGAAILIRAGLGLALFWISYLTLPIAEAFQVAGGFWQPALDATGYFQYAAAAADARTLYPLDHAVPAPLFIDTLTLWMGAVGTSHAAGMLLNLCLFIALTSLMVWCYRPVNDWRRDLPCLVSVGGYAFSPVVLVHSTQPMKEELFGAFVALGCIGLLMLRPLISGATAAEQRRGTLVGAAIITAALLGVAGIRWYFAFIMWCCLALALLMVAINGRRTPLRRYALGSVAVLAAGWVAFWSASGPNYRQVGPSFDTVLEWPAHMWNTTQMARSGFLNSGGSSNIVVSLHDDPGAGRAAALRREEAQRAWLADRERTNPTAPAPPPPARLGEAQRIEARVEPEKALTPDIARSIPVTPLDHVRTAATGLALVFLPISLVGVLTGITVPSGGGLVALSEVDTIFLDLSCLAMLILVWQRRHMIGDRWLSVFFSAGLAGTTAILLGYVVTNFGTLVRMRIAVAIPIWLLGLTLATRRDSVAHPPVAPSGAGERVA